MTDVPESILNLVEESKGGPVPDYTPPAADTQMTEERTTAAKTARQQFLERGDSALEGTAATYLTTFDAATLGLTRPAAGVYGAIEALGQGKNPIKGARTRYGQTDDYFREQANKLPFGLRLGAEMYGAGSKGGIPGRVDRAIERSMPFAPKNASLLQRLKTGAAVGFPVGAMDAYMRQDASLLESVGAGLIDATVGSVMQGVLGERFLPAMARMKQKVLGTEAEGFPAQALVHTGPNQGGLNMAQLYDAAQSLNRGDTLVDIGNMDQQLQATELLHDHLLDLVFDEVDPRKLNADELQPYLQRYTTALNMVNNAYKRADLNSIQSVYSKVGDPAQEFAQIQNRIPSIDKARAVMDKLTTTRANPDGTPSIGATKVHLTDERGDGMLDIIERKLNEKYGTNELGEAPQEVVTVWNRFNDLLRGMEQEGVAKDWRKVVSHGRDAAQAGEVFADVPVARLINARRTLASTMSPGAMIDGNSVTRVEVGATMKVLEEIDNAIAATVGPQVGMARQDFSKYMRVKDAEQLGFDYYVSRDTNVNDKGSFAKHTGESFEELMKNVTDPDVKDAIKAGAKRGMIDRMDYHGVNEELRLLVGPQGGSMLDTKQRGMRLMDQLLGDRNVSGIMEVYNTGNQVVKAKEELADIFDVIGKGKPTDKKKLSKIATEVPWVGPRAEDGMLASTIRWLGRTVAPDDRQKLDALYKMMLLEGPELGKALQRSARIASPGYTRSVTARTTALSGLGDYLVGNAEDEAEKKEIEETIKKAQRNSDELLDLEELLKSIPN